MLKLLLVASLIILGSCATTDDLKQVEQRLEKKTKRNQILMSYYRDHDSCFIHYNKCMVNKKDKCWEIHEKCVISVHKQYQRIMNLTPLQ